MSAPLLVYPFPFLIGGGDGWAPSAVCMPTPTTESEMAEKAEPVLTDEHREELEHLRSKGPVRTEPRTPEEEARLRELELMERDELWAAQDARHAELTERDAKAAEFALTDAERQELATLRKTIDDQNRQLARATEPTPKKG